MAEDSDEFFRQVAFNNGELDPVMRARRDVKNYYASVERGENVVTTPAGPVEQRPGTRFIDYVRHPMVNISIAAATLTAPSGGTVADLQEGAPAIFTTTTDLGADDQVLVTVTFDTPIRVSAVDLVDYAVKEVADPAAVPPPFTYPFVQPTGDFQPFIGDVNVGIP